MNANEPKSIKGYPLIVGYLGIFMILIGVIILLPLVLLLFYPNEADQMSYFIVPGVLSILSGYFLTLITRHKEKAKLEKNQDTVLILFIWAGAILMGSIPFLMHGSYTFSQSIFESTSGFSTTGLTVVDVEETSHMFLFYRSILQFFGGIGLVLVLTSAVSDKYGMRLYNAEGHNDRLLPNLVKSARLIVSLYAIYVTLGALAYILFGMPPFEAVNHAIASVSTGGFSTNADSIGHYQSLPIEWITMGLMLLGSTNLIIHIYLFKGKIRQAFSHIEFKLFAVLILFFLPIVVLSLRAHDGTGFFEALRIGAFQFMSALTTTGFQTVETFVGMPHVTLVSIIILMIIGGGIGSTAGGIKQYRFALSVKQLFWNTRSRLSNQRTLRSYNVQKYGKPTEVTIKDILSNQSHVLMYVMILVTGALIFTGFGYGFEESLFEFGSALGTVGLSIGVLTADSHPVMLWTGSIGMFLGRLEIYVVLIALSKIYIDITGKKVL